MKSRHLTLVMICAAIGAISLRTPLAAGNAIRRLPGTSFVPQERLAKLLTFGHRSTAADLIWLSAIGDLSRDFSDPKRKKEWLEVVFDAVTALEPTFSTVYSWGATYYSMIDSDPERAVALLERGVARNPDDVDLAVDLAMVHFRTRHDRQKAIEVLSKVADNPALSSFSKAFYAALLVKDRQDGAALLQWVPYLEHGDTRIRAMGELQLERAKRNIALRAYNEFKETRGRPPRSTEELRDPALMAPEVADAVLGSMRIDLACKPSFPRCDELNAAHELRSAAAWVALFRSENGRDPTREELAKNPCVRLLVPPPGHHYEVRGDDVVLAED